MGEKEIEMHYICTPLNRYTFSNKQIRSIVESNCNGKAANLFAGLTKLNIDEIRVDVDKTMLADNNMDALDFMNQTNVKFNTFILDPPYSYRKSMEMYNENSPQRNSRWKVLLDKIAAVSDNGTKVITFGYNSNVMGKGRGFELEKLYVFCHGGAMHDTLMSVEIKR